MLCSTANRLPSSKLNRAQWNNTAVASLSQPSGFQSMQANSDTRQPLAERCIHAKLQKRLKQSQGTAKCGKCSALTPHPTTRNCKQQALTHAGTNTLCFLTSAHTIHSMCTCCLRHFLSLPVVIAAAHAEVLTVSARSPINTYQDYPG
jgi:hypothetical protein